MPTFNWVFAYQPIASDNIKTAKSPQKSRKQFAIRLKRSITVIHLYYKINNKTNHNTIKVEKPNKIARNIIIFKKSFNFLYSQYQSIKQKGGDTVLYYDQMYI